MERGSLLLAMFALLVLVASSSPSVASSLSSPPITGSPPDLQGQYSLTERFSSAPLHGEENELRVKDPSEDGALLGFSESEGYYTTERLQVPKPHPHGLRTLILGIISLFACLLLDEGALAGILQGVSTGFIISGLYGLLRTQLRHWFRKKELELDKTMLNGIRDPKRRLLVKKNLLKNPLEGGNFSSELDNIALLGVFLLASVSSYLEHLGEVSLFKTPVEFLATLCSGVLLSSLFANIYKHLPVEPPKEYRFLLEKKSPEDVAETLAGTPAQAGDVGDS